MLLDGRRNFEGENCNHLHSSAEPQATLLLGFGKRVLPCIFGHFQENSRRAEDVFKPK